MIPLVPLIPMLTRVGAMMLAKKYAKDKLRKKILKDAALKKKVDKIGKKALKKEAKKKEDTQEVRNKRYWDEFTNPRTLEPLNTGRKKMIFSIKAIRSNNKVARHTKDKKTLKILAESTKMHKQIIAKSKKPRREAQKDIKNRRKN